MPALFRLVCVAIALAIGPGSAFGQDAKQLVEEGGKFLSANQFPQALAKFLAIPDTAPAEERLAKHTGASHALTNMGRGTEAGAHIEKARPIAEEIATDFARVRFLNAEGSFLERTRRGDMGLGSLLQAAAIAERAGARVALSTVYGTLSTVYQRLEDWERHAYYSQKKFDLIATPTAADRLEYHISRGIAFFEMYERDAAEQESRAVSSCRHSPDESATAPSRSASWPSCIGPSIATPNARWRSIPRRSIWRGNRDRCR